MRKLIRSTLGHLTYNPQFSHFSTRVVHNRSTIEVVLKADNEDGIEKMLPLAEQIWKGRSRHIKAFRDYATTQLIDELNQFLVADDERSERISRQQLQRILRVPFSVTIHFERYSDDTVEFCLAGGGADCLREHCLYVFFAADGTVKDGEVVRLF